MECPKCRANIDDNAVVCPYCKKVLKLTCPICKTLNKTNVCDKCGFVILNKCHNCGKINHTIDGKCKKCGFDTFTSVILNESNTDEFACLTIEFPNMVDIKKMLNNSVQFEKFKTKLDKLIYNYTFKAGLRRQIVNSSYIIRFNKDYSFYSSANNAAKAAIELLGAITKLNFKLKEAKDIQLLCSMAIFQRDVNSRLDDYKSGVNIKLLNNNLPEFKLLSNLQLITDNSVYSAICEKYELSQLTSSFMKNKMVTFFEMDLTKYIEIPVKKVEEPDDENLNESMVMPNPLAQLVFDENLDDKELEAYSYNGQSADGSNISFAEQKNDFVYTKSSLCESEIVRKLTAQRNSIVSVKTDKRLLPSSTDIINAIKDKQLYKTIINVTCNPDMKYKPYGFIYEFLSNLFNFSVSTDAFVNNDFSQFLNLDPSLMVKDMINLNARTAPHPEDVRATLFDIFSNVFASLDDTLIFIENLEKIDDTSIEILQSVFQNIEKLNIGFVILSDRSYSLHKKSHFLLSMPEYSEIFIGKAPFKELIEKNYGFYEKILNSFYLQKIAQNTAGSTLYLDLAVKYLIDSGVLNVIDEKLNVVKSESAMLPPTLNELIQRRFKILSKDSSAFTLLAKMLLLGPRCDFATLKLFENPTLSVDLGKLDSLGYIFINNNAVCIQNYNLYHENMLQILSDEEKKQLASDLVQKLFSSNAPSPITARLFSLMVSPKNEFLVMENLARVNMSMGDFSAYLTCSLETLQIISKRIETEDDLNVEEYKMSVYENIADLLYKYVPDKIQGVAQVVLNYLEKTQQQDKLMRLCNKMLQGCLLSGNYSQALHLIHMILKKMPHYSIKPNDKNFNPKAFMFSLVRVEILFNTGALPDCIRVGEELLSVITPQNKINLLPKNFNEKQFDGLLHEMLGFVCFAKIMCLDGHISTFLRDIEQRLGTIPSCFNLFEPLQSLVRNENFTVPNVACDCKFAKFLAEILTAFANLNDDYGTFATNVYKAKLSAREHNLCQFELLSDLLIGYAYSKLDKLKKAEIIYYDVLEDAGMNGLQMVQYVCWYMISDLKILQADLEGAEGLVNHTIVQLEKNANSCAYILLLFKLTLAKLMEFKGDKDKAEFCYKQIKLMADKSGINIGLEA